MSLDLAWKSFFYNLLPGGYFILVIGYIYRENSFLQNMLLSLKDYFKDSPSLAIVVGLLFITSSLLLGFIFQAFTKLIRAIKDHWFSRFILSRVVKKKQNKNLFERAKKILKSGIQKDVNDNITLFDLMDNFLNTRKTNVLPSHFSERTSLWFNLFWANFILAFLLLLSLCNLLMFVLFIAFTAFSFYIGCLNLSASYDTMLKSFLMIRLFKDKDS